jgi:predicted DNA-binding transcriptional regulator YafY
MSSSDWRAFRRCLAILQRLIKGPATSQELIAHVIEVEGSDAYSSSASAREKAFKRDRESLRQRLGVEFSYSASTRQYKLEDPGDFFSLGISESGVRALALLSETFAGQVGEHSEIQMFLDELVARLPLESRRLLENASLPVNLQLLQQVDSNGISARVWKSVWRAVKEKRKLCFQYISPAYADGLKRYHEVLPYRIQYQWGHWYLRAYRLLRRDVNGDVDRQGAHLRFRLSYIQDDEKLEVMPSLVGDPPRPPRLLVHYRVLPPISRGVISRHFAEMTVKPLEDGSVEVTGYADDEWEAGRILLSYGEYCVVLGGDEVKAWMDKTIRGIKKNYPDAS